MAGSELVLYHIYIKSAGVHACILGRPVFDLTLANVMSLLTCPYFLSLTHTINLQVSMTALRALLHPKGPADGDVVVTNAGPNADSYPGRVNNWSNAHGMAAGEAIDVCIMRP